MSADLFTSLTSYSPVSGIRSIVSIDRLRLVILELATPEARVVLLPYRNKFRVGLPLGSEKVGECALSCIRLWYLGI